MLLKEKDIERWMDKNELPDDMKKEIKKNIKQKLEENKDADLENLFNILPWHTKKYLKRVLCMNTLNKVCSQSLFLSHSIILHALFLDLW